MEGKQHFYSVKEVSESLHLGQTVTRRLVKESGCALKIGGAIRVDYSEFEKYVRETYAIAK